MIGFIYLSQKQRGDDTAQRDRGIEERKDEKKERKWSDTERWRECVRGAGEGQIFKQVEIHRVKRSGYTYRQAEEEEEEWLYTQTG